MSTNLGGKKTKLQPLHVHTEMGIHENSDENCEAI
jgi:hypothetical protein